MTFEEKRTKLNEFCYERVFCCDCPIRDFNDNLGDECEFDRYSDECIEEAYKIAFGGEVKVTADTMANPVQREEINHPTRYAGGKYECIDVMLDVFGKDAVKYFSILNAFKYIWRFEKKNGIEDIEKAIWYLNKCVEVMNNAEIH